MENWVRVDKDTVSQERLRHRFSDGRFFDIHTHAGCDLIRCLRQKWPAAQNLRDLVTKAERNSVGWLVVFPMPDSIFYHPHAAIQDGELRWSGISKFPYQVENQFLLYEAQLFGEHVLPFLSIDPRRKADEQVSWLESEAKASDPRTFYGLKLHTRATQSCATDLLNSPFIGLAKQYDLPILIHAEGPGSDNTSPEHIFRFAAREPHIRVAVAHGCNFDRSLLARSREHPNVYLDISPFVPRCALAAAGPSRFVSEDPLILDYANPGRALLELVQMFPERVIWGTDEPWTVLTDKNGHVVALSDYAREKSTLDSIPYEFQMEIAYENPLRFLFGDYGTGK